MGFASLFDPLNISGEVGSEDVSDYSDTMQGAQDILDPAYSTAKDELTTGEKTAEDTAKSGFQTAKDTTEAGYDKASADYAAGGSAAVDTAKSGYDAAKAEYQDPNVVATNTELYSRILGQGGYSADQLAGMEAKTREEYGTGLKGAEQALSSYYGDSEARGMAGENLARSAADLGATRANSIRDIEVGNAQLAEQQQTDAMTASLNEAYQKAGLDADEAKTVSSLQEKIASGSAALTTAETNALASLAAQEGTTVAELQSKLSENQATLTTEEAKALAELLAAEGNAELTAASQSWSIL